jgi:hypothetical protein
MRVAPLLLVAVLGLTACATSGQGAGAENGPTVQLTVINEYVGAVTAYAIWGAGRVRLGDLGGNRTQVYVTPIRSDRVAVGFQAIGAPPRGAVVDRFNSGPYRESEAIAIADGDALEFRMSAAAVVTVRRLVPGL